MAKRFFCFLLGFSLLMMTGCSLSHLAAAREPVSAYSFCMDTWVQQQWYGEKAQETCDEIESALRELEALVSLYVSDSEISAVNAAAGKHFVPVSADTYAILKGSAAVCAESGGLFDITIAPLSLLWNVTGENPHVPPEAEIEAAKEKVDYRKLLFEEESSFVMLAEEGMSLDLGGVVKGYAAGKMRDIAVRNGVSGFLSIGGNMLVIGEKPDGTDFLVGLRDPEGSESDYFSTLSLPGETMATTGAYERWFEEDGIRYHHVLNPFTGYPAEGGLLSVTVLSEDGLLADCLSTAIFLSGTDGISAALAREDCRVVIVTEAGEVYASAALQGRLKAAGNTAYSFFFGETGE